MRIISGKYKGKRIAAPKKLPVRPTTDMAKEALFNILNNSYYFEKISVLDLFSGTGNISFEFASRGTDQIIAVDTDFGCVKFIDKTAKELHFNITAIKSNAFAYLEKAAQKTDIIFADPPYDMLLSEFDKIPELVFKNQLLQEDGLLIIEHSKHMTLSSSPYFSGQRKYGGSVFSFFENISEN
ncbi:RsmD family RNA methyltransferase [Flavobacteriaceae bacterium F89]|uniref:RsmD family RNA methyltransferase n=1 Tax=Cerina litoralis TaxID=2874477 RepID=A0AAE3ETY1_9FLAO|nr:RsmD family RNA methyltransferase [Cerina litoralis]MCG2459562.1 RsmD family RNA methyltransferase [Cerina litoralis]